MTNEGLDGESRSGAALLGKLRLVVCPSFGRRNIPDRLEQTREMFYRTYAEWIDEYKRKGDFEKREDVVKAGHR